MVSCAARGAVALKSRHTVSPRLARCTSIVPEPAIVDMNGSTTVMAKAVATAASMALPPRSRTRAPTSAPRGCSATTMPWRRIGVVFVTESVERIMRSSEARLRARQVLRDVDDTRAREVDDPAEGVAPRLVGLGLVANVGPVMSREALHLCGVARRRHRRAQQDLDLLLVHS